ncbi:MAG: hotdog fold thioesterase [Saprospiraceae bacterium]|jgi:1,4-dihydroxy-2-naphthoyl-CoA hydrolase|nr:hotdog fold thioesterase [Saprospiraceae bacterium]MBL0025391.1 hotdog fold thioesterase [Saprospiraceae bacterium]
MIWKVIPELDMLNKFSNNTLVSHLGIKIIEIGDDYIKAKMPVDNRTIQPMGLLHGGASVVLSESIGSIGSWLVVGNPEKRVMGLEVNANHLRPAKSGFVYSTTKPVKLGKTLHVWTTEIFNDINQLVCISRLTVMII